jgi:hypothetical protein
MPLNFPSSPTNGQTYTDDNSISWRFDGVKWDVVTDSSIKLYNGVKVNLNSTPFSLTSIETPVSFNTEVFDTNNYFTISNPTRITIRQSGYYRVNFTVFTSVNGSSFNTKIKKNGTTVLSEVGLGPNQVGNYDEVIQLDINDYLEITSLENSAIGSLLGTTSLEITQLGLTLGTNVRAEDAFSGAKVLLTSVFNTTTTSSNVIWDSTEYNQNADSIGNNYWISADPSKLTVKVNGFFRIKSFIQTGVSGVYTITLNKNTSTELANVSLNGNETAQIDEIFDLNANDYIQIYASDTASIGTLTTNTYLEIVRIGV